MLKKVNTTEKTNILAFHSFKKRLSFGDDGASLEPTPKCKKAVRWTYLTKRRKMQKYFTIYKICTAFYKQRKMCNIFSVYKIAHQSHNPKDNNSSQTL